MRFNAIPKSQVAHLLLFSNLINALVLRNYQNVSNSHPENESKPILLSSLPSLSNLPAILTFDCLKLTAEHLGNPDNVFICSDNQTLVMQAEKLEIPGSSLGFMGDEEWVRVKVGSIDATRKPARAMTSCGSSQHGSGAIKGFVTTEDKVYGAEIGLQYSMDPNQLYKASILVSVNLEVVMENLVEYACTATKGKTAQVFTLETKYKLYGWKFQKVKVEIGEEDQEDQVIFSEWVNVPLFEYTDVIEEMICVTNPRYLTCEEF